MAKQSEPGVARWWTSRACAALLVALSLAACTEQEPGGGEQAQDMDAQEDSSRDVSPEEDVSPQDLPEEEVDPERLPLGSLCQENAECADFLCASIAPDAPEQFCSRYCLEDSDCPEAFDCIFLSDGTDVARVCVPVELCLDEDEDGYGLGPGCLGRDCRDDDASIHPGADEICDGVDNDCDGTPDDNTVESGLECVTELPGACSVGRTRCLDQFVACRPLRVGEPEVCDGVDNDCDGLTDEGEDGQPLVLSCYGGPRETAGVGACAMGQRLCQEGAFTECQGQVLPFPELCDGLDNDCDGQVDEDSPGTGVGCDTGLLGVCREGETLCEEGGAVRCEPSLEPSEEICDGLDNDCDGLVDEDEEGQPLVLPCYDGPQETLDVGPCMGGQRVCVEGAFGRCQDQVTPLVEICDGLDNNCDGQADEGNPAGGQLCLTGQQGVCARGQTRCTPDGPVCEPEGEPSEEVCDGLDNDCDGMVDEDAQGEVLARACYTGAEGTQGVGSCAPGRQVCAGGQFGVCAGQSLPQVELCDGQDNDCDGVVDDGDPGGGAACATGQQGVCAAGLTVCQEGAVACVQSQVASVEACDGLDNDCDGQVDEGQDGQPLAVACYSGPQGTQGVGSCRAGRRTCTGGDLGACVEQILPQVELCDGVDNDCDGQTDEGDPGGGVACTTGAQGVCAAGLTVCQEGAVACVQAQAASPEICDGLDNDCDGLVDEGQDGQPLARSCYSGPEGTLGVSRCRAGVELCQEGQFGACLGQELPQAEVCDGADNNCDGQIDEDDPGVGVRCTTGQQGSCGLGTTVCSQGELLCEPSGEPEPEVCDGVDNDCDGQIDEGFAGLGRACFGGEGLCRRAGVLVCDPGSPAGPPICEVEPGEPSAELCDYNDNDCDGQTDEDFRDGNGVYHQAANCGGCGVDCDNRWPGGPEQYNVVPTCQVQGQEASCGFVCAGDYIDVDNIPDNGCEYLPDEGAIYVSSPANGGSDVGGCGAWDSPCATVNQGLGRAQATGRPRVRVSDGVFRESVTLVDGISLLGGHSARTWDRNPEIFVSVLNGQADGLNSSDRVTVSAVEISLETEVSGFTLNAQNAAAGGNSVAVYVRDSGAGFLLRDNVIFAGSGGGGGGGARGPNGPLGTHGAGGGPSLVLNFCNVFLDSSSGGQRLCPDPGGNGTVNVSGGRGGRSFCPQPGERNESGATGQGGQGGGGGLGGGHFLGTVNGCQLTGFAADPLPGNNGLDGQDGGGGAASTDGFGAVAPGAMQWRGATGGGGQHGQQGSGGGGGGSAAGVNAIDSTGEYYYGATGGGAGSGGCAGGGGVGGGAGGGSFGIKVLFSGAGPSNAGQMPRVQDNLIARGNGGRGGDGGPGGAGGDPGLGAGGGEGVNQSVFGFCMADGGAGGDGGRGGHGGGGAGGQGGASFDIFVYNNNGVDPGYGGDNQFALSGQEQTGGAGGQGGNSSNAELGLGQQGPRGASGNLRLVP